MRRERIKSITPLQNPAISSSNITQLGKGPEAAQWSTGEEPTSNNENATQIAIDIIEATLIQREMSTRKKNAWKHTKHC
jgi:hypothetical protein